MQQSKEDGATVAIYYESRLAKLSLKDADLQQLNDDVDELTEDDERNDGNQGRGQEPGGTGLSDEDKSL